MTLNVNLPLCYHIIIKVIRVLTKWLRLGLRGFRYKVALYFSYMFDDKTIRNPFEFRGVFSSPAS